MRGIENPVSVSSSRSSETAPADIWISFVFCTDDLEAAKSFHGQFQKLSLLIGDKDLELLFVVPRELEQPCHQGLKNSVSPSIVRILGCHWGSRVQCRNEGFNAANGQWVYFVDGDTSLIESRLLQFSKVLSNLNLTDEKTCFVSGPYVDGPGTTYWGRCYNFLSTSWLKHSAHRIRFLAGNVVFRKSFFSNPLYNENLVNGGEENFLCEEILRRGGFGSYSEDLAVFHCARHDFRKMLTRFLTHAKEKSRRDELAGKSQISLGLAFSILCKPWLWPACLTWLVAELYESKSRCVR